MESRLQAKIEEGSFYDASQLACACIDRLSRQKDLETCLQFAEKYAARFADAGRHEFAVALGRKVLKLATSKSVKPDEEMLSRFACLFALCPAQSATEEKYKLMEDLIDWSKQSCEDKLEKQYGANFLHQMAAESYLEEGAMGSCQRHLLFCDDTEHMKVFLDKWSLQGYETEKYFFHLRFILALLAIERVETAQKLADLILKDFQGDVPGPIQAAWMVTQSCVHMSQELFEMARAKYTLIFRIDSSFDTLLNTILSLIFKVQTGPTGFMGLLQNMLGPKVRA